MYLFQDELTRFARSLPWTLEPSPVYQALGGGRSGPERGCGVLASSRFSNFLEAMNLFVNPHTLNCYEKFEGMRGLKVYCFSPGRGEYFVEKGDLYSLLIKMLLKNFSAMVITFGGRRGESGSLRFVWPQSAILKYSDDNFAPPHAQSRIALSQSESRDFSVDSVSQKKRSGKSRSKSPLNRHLLKSWSPDSKHAPKSVSLSPLDHNRIINSPVYICKTIREESSLLEDCLLEDCLLVHFGADIRQVYVQRQIQDLIGEKKEFLEWKQNREGLICVDDQSNLRAFDNEQILQRYPDHAGLLGESINRL